MAQTGSEMLLVVGATGAQLADTMEFLTTVFVDYYCVTSSPQYLQVCALSSTAARTLTSKGCCAGGCELSTTATWL